MYLGAVDVDVNRVERDGGRVFDDIEAVVRSVSCPSML